MLRKITAVLMLTCFTNAFAMTPVRETSALSEALSRTFDDMNYSLNVEWDQKDQTFFKTTVEGFETNIKSLQEQGLTNKELIDYTLDKIKDKQTQSDVREIAAAINESDMTGDQARAFALEKLNKTQSQGASWSGSRHGVKLVLILGIIILIACANQNRHDDDDSKRPGHDRPDCRNDDLFYESSFQGGGYNDGCHNFPTYPNFPRAA